MEHAVDPLDGLPDSGNVGDVALDDLDDAGAQCLRQVLRADELVENFHMAGAGRNEPVDNVRSDEPRSPCDQERLA